MVPAFTRPFDLFIIPHLWLKVLQLQTLSPYDLLLTPLACDGGSLRPWVGIHLHCFRYRRIGWFQAWDYAGIGCNYRSHLWIQKLNVSWFCGVLSSLHRYWILVMGMIICCVCPLLTARYNRFRRLAHWYYCAGRQMAFGSTEALAF